MTSALQSLKTIYRNYISPDDVFNAILSKVKDLDIPKDPGIIHNAVYEIKRNEKYRELLKDFHFDNSGLSPFSELLDEILFRLETSGILKTLNPRYERYNITSETKILDESFDKFTEDKKKMIEEISEEFSRYIH